LQCVAVRCSALQCVAVRCSVLQCVAVHVFAVIGDIIGLHLAGGRHFLKNRLYNEYTCYI